MRGMILAATAVLSLAVVTPAKAQQELRFADFLAQNHYISQHLSVPFMKRVEELTGGKVKFRYYPAEQLAKLKDLMDAARNRVADITLVPAQYYGDRIPLSGVVTLPGIAGSSQDYSRAYRALVKQLLQEKELTPLGLVSVGVYSTSAYQLAMVRAPVMEEDGFRGLKIRTAGGSQASAFDLLGGAAVTIPQPEVYTALQRQTVDGTTAPISSVRSLNLYGVLKSITTNFHLGGYPGLVVMNAKVFESLPKDAQAAIMQAGEEVSKSFSDYCDRAEAEDAKFLTEKGVSIYAMPDETVRGIRKKLEPLHAKWREQMNQRNLPGDEAYRIWVKAMEGGNS